MRTCNALMLMALALTGGCNVKSGDAVNAGAGIQQQAFGQTPDGQPVTLFTLTHANGMKARVMNYGAIVVSLEVPDRNGDMADVVLGYNSLAEYIEATPYFGAIVGRYGNRIAAGTFTLDGQVHTLATNNEPSGIPCHLHGGLKGFDKVVWDAEPVESDGEVGLKLHYLSRDGEAGYPGNLEATVFCRLADDHTLRFDYVLKTDKATPVNLTHHGYFNLRGEGQGDILGHMLTIAADRITPVDKGLIPTGEFQSVKGTPFDFTTPHAIGERVNNDHEQLQFGGGYDHNWVLRDQPGNLILAASVKDPMSGRVMDVYTTEPGIQFYGGNFLDGSNVGKSGKPYPYRSGFCLETQHFPDSPNQPNFPSTILRPGEAYRSTTEYRFSVASERGD